MFALQARLLAFKRREPADLNQVPGPQIADALKLLGDNGHFFGLGILLGRQPDDLLLQLLDTLLQLIFLSEARLAAQFEQLALAAKGFLHVRIVGFVRELLRHPDRLGAVPFGAETRLARIEFVETLGDDGQIGPGHCLVETNQNVARLHPITIVRPHFADDAAGRVLHLFHVGIDHQRALGDERAGDFGGRGPAADTEGKERHDGAADNDMPADRSANVRGRLGAHPTPPSPGTTFKARGGALCGWVTRLRISSFGPNCCWRPLAMTRI